MRRLSRVPRRDAAEPLISCKCAHVIPLRGRASASCSVSTAIGSEGLRYRALHSTRFQRAVDKWRLTAAWFRASLLTMINIAFHLLILFRFKSVFFIIEFQKTAYLSLG